MGIVANRAEGRGGGNGRGDECTICSEGPDEQRCMQVVDFSSAARPTGCLD